MRIAILTNPQSPGTDYYRTTGPFCEMERSQKDVQVRLFEPDAMRWHHIYQADVLLVQRPNGSTILGIIKEAKAIGKKVVLDIDDLLHEVDESNPAAVHFSKDQVKRTIEESVKLADGLIVSTPPLAEFYSKYINPNKIVIARNAWNERDHPFSPYRETTNPIRFIYRGSTTHMADLHTIKPALVKMATMDNTASVFVGFPAWLIPEIPKNANTQFVQWQTLWTFYKLMRQSQPDYGFFPLEMNPFNLAKSNIFAIECLVAGAVPIVPMGFPEFDIPGTIRFNSVDTFLGIIDDIHAGKVNRWALVEEGRNYLAKVLNIENENAKRLALLRNL